MPASANQQEDVLQVVIIVALFHQPISRKALLLYSSSFCLFEVDKKKAHLLRFPTPDKGSPPQKPIQREGKEGVRLCKDRRIRIPRAPLYKMFGGLFMSEVSSNLDTAI